jgi:hypothetical protein
MNRIAQAPTAAPGGLLVDFDTDLGPNCQPLDKAPLGMTVQATVTIQSIAPAAGGRARGFIGDTTGTAIFTVPQHAYARLNTVLLDGARVMVRGTVTKVGAMTVLDIWAAMAVSSR